MRTISEALLAAALSRQGRPSVHLTVEDRAIRWRTLHTLSPALDLPCVDGMSNGSLILRAAVSSSGDLYHQEISNPSLASPWQGWTLLAPSASRAGGDVAVAWYNLTWLVYYQRADRWVMMVSSANNGASWSTPLAVYRPGRTAALAACGPYLFVLENTLRAYHLNPNMASWSGPYTLGGYTPDSDMGVAAVIQPTAGSGQIVRLLFTLGGGIRATTYNPATQAFGAVLPVSPGRDQALPTSAAHRWPSLYALDEERLVATWVERWQGDLDAWRHPVSRLSFDGEHWGMELSLANPAITDRRMALIYDSIDEVLYAANAELVMAAEVYDPLLNRPSHLGPLEALSYRVAWRPHEPGHLRATVLDAEGALSALGEEGNAAQALRPLSQVILSRGYITSEGAEEVTLPPHYIVRARRTEGLGGGRVEIEAVDAFGLLALWTPPEPLEWEGRVLRWLAAEVCAQVGLPYADDGRPEMNALLERFTCGPGQSALEALRALLRLSGYVARPRAEGGLYALHLVNHRPVVTPTIGDAGEILRAAYGVGWPGATAVRVVGAETWADGDDIALGGWLGLRRHRYIEDGRIRSAEMAEVVREGVLRLASLSARADEATLFLRPDLELWDVVNLSGLGRRIITALEEHYDAPKGVYETALTLGKWEET
ncbi:MAG: hypothetical protein H5T70_01765 [Chloroflexi bacterium]|nr:hypothetical protein [Chloroflexota bacterium]